MPSSGSITASNAVRDLHRYRRRPLLVMAGLALLAIIYMAWRLLHPAGNPHRLFASGRLEGYETNLSAKIGGRVDWIKYREGNTVKPGELVSQISDNDYQAQLRGAKARIAKAQQAVKQQSDQLEVVRAQIAGATKRFLQSRQETSAQINEAYAAVGEADARYSQAQADLSQARSDLQLATVRLTRYTNLVKKGAVTKDEYDQARTTYLNSQAAVRSKQSNLE